MELRFQVWLNLYIIDISHKLNGKGEKSILVKFTSHKAKTKLYKKRAGLKHVKIADLYPEAFAATRVEGKKNLLTKI